MRFSVRLHRHLPRSSAHNSRYFSSTTAEAVRRHVDTLIPPHAHTAASSPSSSPALSEQVSTIRNLLSHRRRVLVLTGAGISTESGVPDYRSPGRPPHRPMNHQTFVSQESARKRYWARSMIGFARMRDAQPNAGHRAIAQAQQHGRVHHIVTQNVDDLHERAGARDVTHLHGSIHRVECQQCHALSSRAQLQEQLEQLNPAFTLHIRDLLRQASELFEAQRAKDPTARLGLNPSALIPHNHDEDAPMERSMAALRPDGDIELQNEAYYATMVIPPCGRCGGVLKPDVVFFGANVPRAVHDSVDARLAESDAVLVVGTSLTVWSAFRIIKGALARSPSPSSSSSFHPADVVRSTSASPSSHLTLASAASSPCLVAVVNDGPTRADDLIAPELRIAGRAGTVLAQLLA